MTAKALPKCRFCRRTDHKERCPLCGGLLHSGGFDENHADDSLCCTRKGCWYFVVNMEAHRAICAKIAAKGGKALATGYFCRKGFFFFQTAGPEKCSIDTRCKVGCVRCEVREAEGGK